MPLSIALATPSLQTCSLVIENYTADTVSLKYNTLSGNQPYTNENTVKIWESSVIPWGTDPLTSERVPQDGQSGTMVLGGVVITDNPYIIGYAVGEDVSEICTTAAISAGGLRDPTDYVYLSVASISETSLTLNYYTLYGYLPKAYGNWIGLWEGYASPFLAPRPLAKTRVRSNSNQGTVTMSDLELKPDTVYTLVYFMGPDEGSGWPRPLTNGAAILNIQTVESESVKRTSNIMLLS